jgi:hypothetical protein
MGGRQPSKEELVELMLKYEEFLVPDPATSDVIPI